MFSYVHRYSTQSDKTFLRPEVVNLVEVKSKEIKIPPEFDISNNCKNVLKGLLQKEPSIRMSWEELFNHDRFKKDEIMDMENKLIDIPIGKSLPDLGSFELNKQHFCSFKHKSIVNTSQNSMNSQDNKNNESNKSNNSNESNDSNTCFHMELSEELNNKMPTESYINRELDNIIKEELKKETESDNESDNESEEDEKELFKSAQANDISNNIRYSIHNKIPKTEPININYPKNYPKVEPQRRCPDVSKLVKEFNYRNKISTKDAIRRFHYWTSKYY